MVEHFHEPNRNSHIFVESGPDTVLTLFLFVAASRIAAANWFTSRVFQLAAGAYYACIKAHAG